MNSMNQNPDQKLDSSAETAPVVEAFQIEEGADQLPHKQYCVFRAGRERFCFAVLEVEEVVEWPKVTAVPLAPPFLMGIFNLRGLIIPVIDIGLTESRRPDLSPKHVVVACLRGQEGGSDLRLGVAADEVFGAVTTTEPLLLDEAPRDVPYCCGMLRDDGRLALALDLKKLTESFPVPVI